MRSLLESLETTDLRSLYRDLKRLQRSLNLEGPQTDDELHQWILLTFGVDVPRVSVCEGHRAPFEFLADLFFERVTAAVAVANRGGSKTFISALLHHLNSKFKRMCESASVGAVETQALRAYENLKFLLKREANVQVPEDNPDVASSIQRETRYKNDSRVEVLVGTINGVNGPHPQKVHADEVELMDPVVFDESRNMSSSKHGIKAQDWITSTRKRAHGPMQAILDDIARAQEQGVAPPYEPYFWCIFETAANVPNCGDGCGCHDVVKGKWEDGKPRRFSDVCQGRLKRSQGWIPLYDVHKTFRTVSRPVWEAQQECKKPSTEGLVFANLDKDLHGVKWYIPDMSKGYIALGVDFGGSNPFGINWYHVLKEPVLAYGIHQQQGEEPTKEIPAGARVCFDEVYKAEIGNQDAATLVKKREAVWSRVVPDFRVVYRFADPQAKAARIDWAVLGLKTQWYADRDVKEQIKTCNDLIDDDLFYADILRCKMFWEESEQYHYPDKRAGFVDDPEIPVDDFNHCMSDFRYVMQNIKFAERRLARAHGRPKTSGGVHVTASNERHSPGVAISRDTHVTAGRVV